MSHAPFDPIALGESVARATLTQDRRPRLTALRGGRPAGVMVPGRKTEAESPIPEQHFTLSADRVRTLLIALGQHGVPTALQLIADDMSGQVHPSLLPSADWCSPTGMERPL